MKRLILLAVTIFAVTAVFGQTKNVNKANTAFTKGELAEAAAYIEPAITDEKTKVKSRTWYTRGQIFDAIAMSEDESVRSIDPEALSKAAESYRKTMELEKDGSSYFGLAQIKLDQLYGAVLGKGVENYQNEDFEAAYQSFLDVQTVNPTDTTGYLYAAMMAQQLDMYDEALANYQKIFDLGYYPEAALNSSIYLELNEKDNAEKALEMIKLAQEKYPDNNNFQKQEVDILIKLEKLDEAIVELKEASDNEPDNALLLTNLGMLYDFNDDSENAIHYYKKALEIEPGNRNALINLAVLHIGNGDEINKKAINMDIRTYNKEGAEVEALAKLEWNKAVPLLEKVLEADEKDELALQNLQAVYSKLRDVEKAQEYYDLRVKYGYVAEEDN
jgi:tetratricopeptide (TPR) repeat protein